LLTKYAETMYVYNSVWCSAMSTNINILCLFLVAMDGYYLQMCNLSSVILGHLSSLLGVFAVWPLFCFFTTAIVF
jgi:hypothetical protein